MSRPQGFVLIERIYSTSESALVIAALEGADIPVLTQGFHHHANAPHLALALQGVGIFVPAARAEEARAFLDALAAGDVTLLDSDSDSADPARPEGELRAQSLYMQILTLILCWWASVAPVLHGRFQRPPAKRRND